MINPTSTAYGDVCLLLLFYCLKRGLHPIGLDGKVILANITNNCNVLLANNRKLCHYFSLHVTSDNFWNCFFLLPVSCDL